MYIIIHGESDVICSVVSLIDATDYIVSLQLNAKAVLRRFIKYRNLNCLFFRFGISELYNCMIIE